jgi:prepilin-type N-terminal cleavage/methylation domain-containing protein
VSAIYPFMPILVTIADYRRRGIAARQSGMTLIEVLAVIAIIGLTSGILGLGFGAWVRADLKSGCNQVLSAARFAYNRALIRGATVRLTFAIPGSELAVEETHGRVTLARADDERRKTGEESSDSRGADVDPWKAAKARLQDTFKPSLGASSFEALTDEKGKSLAKYSKIVLGRRVRIVKLITPHDLAPRESGKGSIYFFSGGLTEHAVVQLSDGADTVYSVEIHPLTGRGQVYAKAYEPPEILDEAKGEREVSEVNAP